MAPIGVQSSGYLIVTSELRSVTIEIRIRLGTRQLCTKNSAYLMIKKVLLFLCLFGLFQNTYSQTPVSGTITSNTTWDLTNSPYEVTGDVTVITGVTLTIEAGVQISLPVYTNDIIVDGTLVAVGSASQPIILTGPGGIDISETSDNSILEFIEYTGVGNVGSGFLDNTFRAGIALGSAGSSSISNVRMNDCDICLHIYNDSQPSISQSTFTNATNVGIQSQLGQPIITNCTIDQNAIYGVQLTNGSGTIQNNTFSSNGSSGKNSALYLQNPMTGLIIENNTFITNHQDLLIHAEMADDELYDNNGLTVVQIDQGTIASNTTWQKPLAPEIWTYAMSAGAVNVNASVTLTIEPGVIIQPTNNIQVQGTVIAQGTSSEPIQFFGAGAFNFLTNSTGSVFEFIEYYGTKSDGGGVFRMLNSAGPVSLTNSLIDNCRFGILINGQDPIIDQNTISNCNQAIESTSSSPIITNNVITDNDFGVEVTQGSPTISNNTFTNNGSSGDLGAIKFLSGITNPVIENNSFSGNTLDIVTHPEVTDDEFFDTNGLSKVFIDNVAIENDVTWHTPVSPEIWEFEMLGTVTVNSGITLTLEAGLVINSTAYTHDIDVQGTLLAVGTSVSPIRIVGAGGIDLSETSVNSVIDHLDWQGIGNTSAGGGDRTFGAGISIGGITSMVSNIEMDDCRTCIYIYNNAAPALNDLTLSNAFLDGMYVDSGSPTIANSCITNPGDDGLENAGGGSVNAINNWWGDPSGPFNASSNSSGTGSSVTDGVVFNPWLTVDICNPAITITVQPQDIDECEGTDVSFSVQASGANNLQYQWQEDPGSGFINLTDGGTILGTQTPNLGLTAITPIMDGFLYRCVVSGDNATDETSASASLNVTGLTRITTDPIDQIQNVGETVSFNVTASGENLTYQWQKDGIDISNETTSNLTLNSVMVSDQADYTCVVTGSCGTVISSVGSLIVIDTNISFSVIDLGLNQPITNGQQASINFGQTSPNQNINRSFSIENNGAETLNINTIASSDQVFEISNIPEQVPVSGSQSFEIIFSSMMPEVYTSTITLLTDAGSFLFPVSAEVVEMPATGNLIVYNAVAPNGNGKHDFLKIENIETFPNNAVQIFNRWGAKVYEATGYDNQNTRFNGLSNLGSNKELIEGTYFYVIDVGNETLNGFFILRR